MVHGRECTPEERREIEAKLADTVAQSQIVALQSKLYALERKVNDLIDALPMSPETWARVKPIKERNLI